MKNAYKAIMKLAIDIIKVDRSIHFNEINFIKQLREEYKLSDNDVNELNKFSFQEAVCILQNQNKKIRYETMSKLTQLVKADNWIDPKESYLLFAIKMALSDETKDKVQLLTVDPEQIDFYGKQIIYLEKQYIPRVNSYIKENINFIQTIFNSLNIDFFYVPDVLQKAKSNKEFMADIIKYLMPYFSLNTENTVETVLGQIDHIITSSRFEKEIIKRFGDIEEEIQFDSYLLMKVQNSYIVNSSGQRVRKSDFICINASIDYLDTLLKNVLVTYFQKEDRNNISFRGYHRILFEILSDETKSDWDLVVKKDKIGSRKFYLQGHNDDNIEFELNLTPLERILYLLFLVYGKVGIRSYWFVCLGDKKKYNKLSKEEQVQVYLLQENMNIIDRFINRNGELTIQDSFSNSKSLNSKISLIRKAIRKIPNIRNLDDFLISNQSKDKYSILYDYRNIPLSHTRIYIEEKKEKVLLEKSLLWKKIKL